MVPMAASGHPLPEPPEDQSQEQDRGVLRTVGDAHAYIVALPKNRALRADNERAK